MNYYEEFGGKTLTAKQLHEYFSDKQLRMIDFYYELGQGYSEDDSIEFSDCWHNLSNKEQLTAIMKNIVKNNGDFVPDKKWTTHE